MFGFRLKQILRGRRPLLNISLEVMNPLFYNDGNVSTERSIGQIVEAEIYIDGTGILVLGEYPDGAGMSPIEAPLEEFNNILKPLCVVKVHAKLPYSPEIESAIEYTLGRYGLRY